MVDADTIIALLGAVAAVAVAAVVAGGSRATDAVPSGRSLRELVPSGANDMAAPTKPSTSSSGPSTSGVEQSTPDPSTPSPTGPVAGPAEQVREPSVPTSEVDDEVDYDPNVYATADSDDLVSRDTAAGKTTPDPGDSQVNGRRSEAADDDLNQEVESSRNAKLFDRLANKDSTSEL